jgi:hypothetical protein
LSQQIANPVQQLRLNHDRQFSTRAHSALISSSSIVFIVHVGYLFCFTSPRRRAVRGGLRAPPDIP